ncbi:hypothetical protein MPTK1_2g17020 [Marchantia polymorpha subsp. ruderalis]|uniref:Uncharacterized protein n=1 Tax=Marchantia polymorpha TaxID=3197 RepID=A0A2R6WCN4_MARPO|nr:hypothetical protein MARPO_0109s0043 [Marchantia polymorpha]BBN02657.1 hypothetical protein Mp_2g17020 [Marchantia polymorpha subsp. ruderalis]|eukprot:PTQ31615.1 hypothetical protein MARPO_0109s0043 [Marchantia polymorpha]
MTERAIGGFSVLMTRHESRSGGLMPTMEITAGDGAIVSPYLASAQHRIACFGLRSVWIKFDPHAQADINRVLLKRRRFVLPRMPVAGPAGNHAQLQ